MAALNAAKALAKSLTITPNEAAKHGLALNRDGQRRSAFELLAYPEIGWAEVRGIWPELSAIDPAIAVHLEIDAKYDVYLKRQTADVDAFRRDEGLILTGVDYADVPGLSNEARSKLEAARPRTVGQAGRIDGMTPAALGYPGGLSAAGSAKEAGCRVRLRSVSRETRPHPRMANPARQAVAPVLASDKAAALALTPVSRETEARLDRYVDLLLEWQAKTNLVAPSTLPNLWTRHIADSLQLLTIAPSAKIWVDLGSGGGFPGVVLACALGGYAGSDGPSGRAQCQEGRVPARGAASYQLARHRFIWRISGIVWIESPDRSIASQPARWLRYTSSSASRNRW